MELIFGIIIGILLCAAAAIFAVWHAKKKPQGKTAKVLKFFGGGGGGGGPLEPP